MHWFTPSALERVLKMLSVSCASHLVENLSQIYGDRLSAKWGVQIAGMIFKTCSRTLGVDVNISNSFSVDHPHCLSALKHNAPLY